MILRTALPFKLEVNSNTITSHAGLALLREFCVGLNFLRIYLKLTVVRAIKPLNMCTCIGFDAQWWWTQFRGYQGASG